MVSTERDLGPSVSTILVMAGKKLCGFAGTVHHKSGQGGEERMDGWVLTVARGWRPSGQAPRAAGSSNASSSLLAALRFGAKQSSLDRLARAGPGGNE
jgi:hypothetical protein